MKTLSKHKIQKELDGAKSAIDKLLKTATKKGGIEQLNNAETTRLNKQMQQVKKCEEAYIKLAIPTTIGGLLELKMYELDLSQASMAKLLDVTDSKLSEILHGKRSANVAFLQAMHVTLKIDGDQLLKVA